MRQRPDPRTAAFCRGYLCELVFRMVSQRSYPATPERHDACERVLYWLAAHPLPRREFERLLAHRAERSPDEEVRSLCADLLRCWGREFERDRLLQWAERSPELPAWPEWVDSPGNHPRGSFGARRARERAR